MFSYRKKTQFSPWPGCRAREAQGKFFLPQQRQFPTRGDTPERAFRAGWPPQAGPFLTQGRQVQGAFPDRRGRKFYPKRKHFLWISWGILHMDSRGIARLSFLSVGPKAPGGPHGCLLRTKDPKAHG